LRRLPENVQRRRPELWQEQTCLLYHDNASFHTSVLTQQFLEKFYMAVNPHPPYSPDLAHCDFLISKNEIEAERTLV
jgi:transposase